jgi:hypothetical protein
LAGLCLIVFIWFTFLLLKPENVPIPLKPENVPIPARGLDTWVRAHWTVLIWIIVAIIVSDLMLTFDRFQTGTKKKLEALEKQVAVLKSDQRDLDHKV